MAHSEQTNGLGNDREAQGQQPNHTGQEPPASAAERTAKQDAQDPRMKGRKAGASAGPQAPSPRRKGLLFCCLAAAFLVGGYVFLCGMGSQGRIFPHVTVSGVSLGGLTVQQAQAALEKAEQGKTPDESRGVSFLVTTAQGEEMTVQVPLSSVVTDPTATVERAWQVGNTLPFPLRGGRYLQGLFQETQVLPSYRDGESLDTILDQVEEKLGREPVEPTWESDETQLTLTQGQPGNRVDREAIKAQVFDYLGRDEMVTLEGAEPQFTVRLEQLLPQALDMNQVLSQVEREVQDAKFDKEAKVFQTDHTGLTFDPVAAQTFFDNLAWGTTETYPLDITQPAVTVEDLTPKLYQDVLGSCTTNISGSSNRVENIRLAAQYFSGTVLMPGEEFSYNGTVGRRTSARGFLPAPAYVGGETVQETGGGVCQGSSTIYLATLRANLEIVERYPHGYITRYVPDGMDATVYYGVKDFRFKNNTPFPVKVVGTVSGRTLTVNILGTKSDNITVEMTNQVVGTTGYNTVYKVDSSLPAGSTKVSVTPYTGYTVNVYRNLYENGRLKDTKLESTSVYRSRDKVVLVSPEDAAQYGL